MRVNTDHIKTICYLQNKKDITSPSSTGYLKTEIHKNIFRFNVPINTRKRLKINQVHVYF